MKITKKTLISFISACLFALCFTLNLFPMFKSIKVMFNGGLNGILFYTLSLASVLAIGGLAAVVLFRRRTWEIPALLAVPLVNSVTSRLYYLIIGVKYYAWGAFIIFDLLFTSALIVYAYFLIFKPCKVLRKLWFIPIILESVTFLYIVARSYGINIFINLLYCAAICLMFFWLAHPKGKAKTVAFDKAPSAVSGEGDLFVPFVGHILLILFTCGVYAYIWYFKTTKKLNAYSEDKRSPVGELMLCLFVPLYVIFWTYRTARIVTEIGKDKVDFDDFPTACLLLAIFSFGTAPILLQDKLNTLAKIFEGEKKASDAEFAINSNATPESLLERAKILMGEGKFAEADGVLNTCLMIAPQNADAYLYKFLAKYGVCDLNDFYNLNYNIGADADLANVINFAADERRKQIEDIVLYLSKNNEYLNAVALFDAADSAAEYTAVKEGFEKIAEFKDSREYIEKCDAALNDTKTVNVAEQTKLLIKVGILFAIITVGVASISATTYFVKQSNYRKATYKEAVALMDAGNYEDAKGQFDKITEYKDSADRSAECARLDELSDKLEYALVSNFLTVNFEDYKDLDLSSDKMKTAIELNEKFGKYLNLSYDEGANTATLKMAFTDTEGEIKVQLVPSRTTRRVNGTYTSMSDFSETVSAKTLLGKLPLTLKSTERVSKYGYSGDLTINEDGAEYTYYYREIVYDVVLDK